MSTDDPESFVTQRRETLGDSFADRLEREALPILKEILNHPMITEMGAGTLEKSAFETWVKQDYQYLIDDGRMYAAAAADVRDLSRLQRIMTHADHAVTKDLSYYDYYIDHLSITKQEVKTATQRPAPEAYGNFLMRAATAGDLGDVMAATLPCHWWYFRIGQYLKPRLPTGVQVYDKWIKRNGDPSYKKDIQKYKQFLDTLAAESSNPERKRYLQRFLEGGNYEYLFWDACYTGQTWPGLNPFRTDAEAVTETR